MHLVYVGVQRATRTGDLTGALRVLETDLKLYVAEFARRRVFVHAGAVAVNGKAILLPGKSRAGKSTLVAELVRCGAQYLSDEFAVLDASGRVHPYSTPISLREGEPPLTQAPARSLPVCMIVLSRYVEGARWRPRSVSAGQATLALLANAVAARRFAKRVVPVLATAAAGARVVYSPRGEAGPVARQLIKSAICL